jgi:hypothetical protein
MGRCRGRFDFRSALAHPPTSVVGATHLTVSVRPRHGIRSSPPAAGFFDWQHRRAGVSLGPVLRVTPWLLQCSRRSSSRAFGFPRAYHRKPSSPFNRNRSKSGRDTTLCTAPADWSCNDQHTHPVALGSCDRAAVLLQVDVSGQLITGGQDHSSWPCRQARSGANPYWAGASFSLWCIDL